MTGSGGPRRRSGKRAGVGLGGPRVSGAGAGPEGLRCSQGFPREATTACPTSWAVEGHGPGLCKRLQGPLCCRAAGPTEQGRRLHRGDVAPRRGRGKRFQARGLCGWAARAPVRAPGPAMLGEGARSGGASQPPTEQGKDSYVASNPQGQHCRRLWGLLERRLHQGGPAATPLDFLLYP